ncbi:MAG: hypothetical protein WAZ22_10545 [Mesotoga infera]
MRREEERGENGKSGTRGERVEVRGEKSRILIFLPLTSFLLPLFRNEREEQESEIPYRSPEFDP